MSRLVEVRDTHRPPEEVFAYVSDFSTTAEYDPGVARAARTDGGPLGPGATFAVDAVFLGRTLPMTYRIVAWDPPRRVTLEGVGATTTARDEIRFEPLGDGTRITWTLDLALRGPSRLATPLLRPFLTRLGRQALDGLKRRLDAPLPLRPTGAGPAPGG